MAWQIVPVYQNGRIHLAIQPVQPPKHIQVENDIDGNKRVLEMDLIPEDEQENSKRVIITDI